MTLDNAKMDGFKHILVPFDFGEAAEHAADYALELATKFDAKVTFLHAYHLPVTNYAYATGLLWPIDDLATAAKRELDMVLAKAKARHVNTRGIVVCGEPWQQILDAAEQGGVDLIVMGTHGRRGLSRAFLGSVAEKVVRLSPIPVLTLSGRYERAAKDTAVEQSQHA